MSARAFPLVFTSLFVLAGCSGAVDGPPQQGSGATGATTGGAGPSAGGSSGGSKGSSGGSTGSGATGGTQASGGSGGSGNASGSGGASGSAGASGAPPAVYGSFARLTRAEYRATIEAAFAVTPDLTSIPEDGRVGQYTSNVTVTPDPVHPYLLAAEELAAELVPAELPACEAGQAEACLEASYREPLEQLYRRPITSAEIGVWASLFETLLDAGASATDATRAIVSSALLSPDFLFRASPVAGEAGENARRLAETLSFALWDAPPDAALASLGEASAAELSERLAEQAERLGSDARATPVIARFLAQWLRVDTDLRLGEAEFATSPRFLELLAYVEDALENGAPVSDFVAGRRGFVHRDNLDAYGLDSVGGSGDVVAVDWPSPRRGLLSAELFADATRHPDVGRRPIFRGKLVRTSLLCDPIESPDAELLELADEVSDRTADPRCRGCHQMLDPIGYAFEGLDQDLEGTPRGAEISDHPELEGSYADLAALLEAVGGSRAFAECFSRHWLAFFFEQAPEAADAAYVAELAELVEAGASLREVMARTIQTLEARATAATPWCEGS